jgi:hypothetical protein
MWIIGALIVCANLPVFAILLDRNKGNDLHKGVLFILCLYGTVWLLAGLPWNVLFHLALASPLVLLGYLALLSALRKVHPNK